VTEISTSCAARFLDNFTYFENIGSRTNPRFAKGLRLVKDDGLPLVMDLQMIVPIAFDWDQDGDFDLIVGDEDGRVALVENTGHLGSDHAPRFLPPRYFQQEADTLKCGCARNSIRMRLGRRWRYRHHLGKHGRRD
jgi:hypothetical protein